MQTTSVAAAVAGRGIANLTGTIIGHEIVQDHVEYIIQLQCELLPLDFEQQVEIEQENPQNHLCWRISRRYNAFRRYVHPQHRH